MSTSGPYPPLLTENLTLRGVTVEDAADLFEVHSNERVMRYFGALPQQSVDETRAWIRGYFKNAYACRWGITLKHAPKIIGTIGYHGWNHTHKRIEIGYALAPTHWRQGIMSEALSAVVRFAFDQMGIHRIQALVEPRNIASCKLLEKFGFQREGLLRAYEINCGRSCDLFLFALLRAEFCAAVSDPRTSVTAALTDSSR
jgi:ribosomal-protein-alanine N-acetyltransferase